MGAVVVGDPSGLPGIGLFVGLVLVGGRTCRVLGVGQLEAGTSPRVDAVDKLLGEVVVPETEAVDRQQTCLFGVTKRFNWTFNFEVHM